MPQKRKIESPYSQRAANWGLRMGSHFLHMCMFPPWSKMCSAVNCKNPESQWVFHYFTREKVGRSVLPGLVQEPYSVWVLSPFLPWFFPHGHNMAASAARSKEGSSRTSRQGSRRSCAFHPSFLLQVGNFPPLPQRFPLSLIGQTGSHDSLYL